MRGSKVVMVMWSHDVVGWYGDQESAQEQCKHQGLEQFQRHCGAHPLPHCSPIVLSPAMLVPSSSCICCKGPKKPLWLEENSLLVTHAWITCTSCLCSWPEKKVQFHKRRGSAGSHPKTMQRLVCSRALQAYMSQRVLRIMVH